MQKNKIKKNWQIEELMFELHLVPRLSAVNGERDKMEQEYIDRASAPRRHFLVFFLMKIINNYKLRI